LAVADADIILLTIGPLLCFALIVFLVIVHWLSPKELIGELFIVAIAL
jgi:hypothetical protein